MNMLGKNITQDKFDELNDKLQKNKPDFTITCYGDEGSDIYSVHELIEDLEVHQLDDKISIVKSNCDRTGHMRRKYLKPNKPPDMLASVPHHLKFTIYYVLKENRLVTDEKEIKEIIQKTTGVELTKLDNSDMESYKRADKHIKTDFSYNEPYKVEDIEVLPNAEETVKQAHRIKKLIESLPEEFGLKDLDRVVKYLKGIKAEADECSVLISFKEDS